MQKNMLFQKLPLIILHMFLFFMLCFILLIQIRWLLCLMLLFIVLQSVRTPHPDWIEEAVREIFPGGPRIGFRRQ